MKNKATLVKGIIMCAQSILFDAFALYAGIPLLANLWFGDLYSDEKTVTVFSLVLWIGISIGASITLNIGKNKIFEYFNGSPSTTGSSGNYTPTESMFVKCPKCSEMNSSNNQHCFKCGSSLRPSQNVPRDGVESWICPNCGKSNSHYIGTCGCGQKKPNN